MSIFLNSHKIKTREDYVRKDEGQSITHDISWIIEQYKFILKNKRSRNLKIYFNNTGNEVRFQLKIQILGHDNDIIDLYFLSLHPVLLNYTVCLRHMSISEVATTDYHNVLANKWHYMGTIYKRDIVNGYQTDLHIQYKFTVLNHIKDPLPENFKNLLQSALYSDMTMMSSDGSEHKVHKAVLSSRSPVLKAHFEHNTEECDNNTIESAFETDVLEDMLTFIYTNEAPKVNEIPEKLLLAADYYQLDGLVKLCEVSLYRKLTVNNAMEMLQLADNCSAKILKQLILEFIKEGPSRSITKTEGWAKTEGKLIKEICEHILEDDVTENEGEITDK